VPRRRREGRATVRAGEAEPRRRRDVPGGGDHEQGQGGAPRRRLRRLQEVGRYAEPHARHVHRRLRQDRAAAPGLIRQAVPDHATQQSCAIPWNNSQ
jgi:hypothetical protein